MPFLNLFKSYGVSKGRHQEYGPGSWKVESWRWEAAGHSKNSLESYGFNMKASAEGKLQGKIDLLYKECCSSLSQGVKSQVRDVSAVRAGTPMEPWWLKLFFLLLLNLASLLPPFFPFYSSHHCFLPSSPFVFLLFLCLYFSFFFKEKLTKS